MHVWLLTMCQVQQLTIHKCQGTELQHKLKCRHSAASLTEGLLTRCLEACHVMKPAFKLSKILTSGCWHHAGAQPNPSSSRTGSAQACKAHLHLWRSSDGL